MFVLNSSSCCNVCIPPICSILEQTEQLQKIPFQPFPHQVVQRVLWLALLFQTISTKGFSSFFSKESHAPPRKVKHYKTYGEWNCRKISKVLCAFRYMFCRIGNQIHQKTALKRRDVETPKELEVPSRLWDQNFWGLARINQMQ